MADSTLGGIWVFRFYGWSTLSRIGAVMLAILMGASALTMIAPDVVGDDANAVRSPDWISVTSPSSGEVLVWGATYTIDWSWEGDIGLVTIELWQMGWSFYGDIVAGLDNQGSYEWTVPDTVSAYGFEIRVYNASDSMVYGMSGDFEIRSGRISVTSPTSDDSWRIGTSRLITWTWEGSIDLVSIDLITAGVVYMNIASDLANVGYYDWMIPWSASALQYYYVNVSNAADSLTYGLSGVVHIYIAEINVTSPSAGAVWNSGNNYWISWGSSGAGPFVTIDLYAGDSLSCTIVNHTDNSGLRSWTLAQDQSSGSDYRIKITSDSDITIFGFSDYFTIERPGNISISSPVWDTSWEAGTTQAITWDSYGAGDEVSIELLKWGTLITTLTPSTPNDGVFEWAIPARISLEDPGDFYQIRVSSLSNLSLTAYTSYSFEVRSSTSPFLVVFPYSGDTAWAGTVYDIVVRGMNNPGSWARLELYENGNPICIITEKALIYPDPWGYGQSYSWYVPREQHPGDIYQIRAVNLFDDTIFAFSEVFSIATPQPQICVKEPGYDELAVPLESNLSISWYCVGHDTTSVVLELWDGYSGLTIDGDAYNSGDYSWCVPSSISPGSYHVKVISKANAEVYGFSGYFTIVNIAAEGWISCQQPNRSWGVNSSVEIQWSSVNAGPFVSIDLCFSADYGSQHVTWFATINSNTTNDGSYLWMVPPGAYPTQYNMYIMVRITSLSKPWVFDMAHASIVNSWIRLESPSEGDSLQPGSTCLITWSSNDISGDVSIDLEVHDVDMSIVATCSADAGSYEWSVPTDLLPGYGYSMTVRPSGEDGWEWYDTVYSLWVLLPSENGGATVEQAIVVTSPENGDEWEIGTTHVVSWTWTGNISCVKIELVKSGTVAGVIAANTSCDGSYEWVVTDSVLAGDGYQVKVTCLANASVCGTGAGTFSIEAGALKAESESNSVPLAVSIASLALAGISIAVAMIVWRKKA
jgi:hypothetical protein